MSNITKYGACPQCGQICQPDIIGPYCEGALIKEYAVCCECKIIWEYTRIAGGDGTIAGLIIETFEEFGDEPHECKEHMQKKATDNE